MSAPLVLPEQLRDLPLILSVSGGKDSTAMMLAVREAGLPFRAVFADTGWEAPETYAYLDLLREKIGPIDVVTAAEKSGVARSGSTMADRIRRRAGFPARMQRWCTRELKIEPLRAYHDTVGDDTVSVVGVRADESEARSKMLPVEDDCEWGGWIWRPMLAWTIADTIAIHHRHGIPVNPLYQRGHSRVGCYPCIFAQKEEIRLVADHSPERINEIRALEAEVLRIRADRNAEVPETPCARCGGLGELGDTHEDTCDTTADPEEPCSCGLQSTGFVVRCMECNGVGRVRVPRYKHPHGTFFQTTTPGRRSGMVPIDEVVAWSRTSKGGRQLPLLAEPPSGGCFRWGLCEPPSKEAP